MKASELKPGMVVDGWTVAEAIVYNYHGKCPSGRPGALIEYVDDPLFILLELERWYDASSGHNQPSEIRQQTRRTWYRADEEVEAMR